MAEPTDTEQRFLLWAWRLALLVRLHARQVELLMLSRSTSLESVRSRVLQERVEALRVRIRQRKAELVGAVPPEPRQSLNHARKWQL